MNDNNLAQHINFILGSDELDLNPMYLQTTNLPGVSFSHPETGTTYNAKVHVQADTMTFNNLNLTVLLKEDFSNYRELMEKAFDLYNPETGQFKQKDFNLYIINNNLKGNFLFKVDYYGCKIESIDDIDLSTNDDSIPVTFSFSVVYDYYIIDWSRHSYETAFEKLAKKDSLLNMCSHGV